MRARIAATTIAVLLCTQSWAASPNGHQYMARIKYLFVQPNASAPAPIKDVVKQLGGNVDFDLRNWLVITIPDAAYQAIRSHPAVKYLQRVVSGPFVQTTSAEGHDIGVNAVPATNSLPPWTSGTYTYDGADNIKAIGSDSFTYDGLSRLVQANVKGRTETYTYDAFGNLTYKTTYDPTTSPPTTLPIDLTTNTATNHLNSEVYDAAGDLTGDSSETNAFDPVTMQREKDVPGSQLSELYVYNASDERVGVFECSGPPATCGGATMIWSIRDENGKVLRQYVGTYLPGGPPSSAPPWAWLEDYVYRDGLLLGSERVPVEGGRRHFHLDHLGTPRLVTDSTGGQMASRDYYPFGVEIPPSFQDTANGYDREEPMRFTGHERDFNKVTTSENSNYNDFMHARPTVPQWGRFLSVDPNLDFEKNVREPQRWNRYSYVQNNPLRYTDPNGRDAWDTINGFANAFISDLGLTVRIDGTNADYQVGQLNGDRAGVASGFIISSVSAIDGIAGATPTGGATLVAGGVGVAYGTAVMANAGVHLAQDSNPHSGGSGEERNPAQDKRLSKNEVKALQNAGHDVHELKGGENASKYDLFKDKNGNVYVKPKNGDGPGEPTGINLNDLRN